MLLSVLGETTNLHQICSLDLQKSSLMHIKKRLKEPFASTVFKAKYFIMAGSFLSFIDSIRRARIISIPDTVRIKSER